MVDRCIFCGQEISEGVQICYDCEMEPHKIAERIKEQEKERKSEYISKLREEHKKNCKNNTKKGVVINLMEYIKARRDSDER